MSATNYTRNIPSGWGSVKIYSAAANGTSEIAQFNQGGSVTVQLVGTKASSVTALTVTLYGRTDPSCPWFTLTSYTQTSFTLTTSSGADGMLARGGTGTSNYQTWPQMRAVVTGYTGSGDVDLWMVVAP